MEQKEGKKISWKDLGPDKIILLVIAGVFLLVSNTSFQEKETGQNTEEKSETGKETVSSSYARRLAGQLEEHLSKVEGVGKTEVMITLKSSGEAVLNKDTEKEESEKNAEESTEYNLREQEETVLADQEGTSAPYVVKELEPEIAGVIITCEGADNNLVKSAVTEAASVLFSIPYNRIKVMKMEESK